MAIPVPSHPAFPAMADLGRAPLLPTTPTTPDELFILIRSITEAVDIKNILAPILLNIAEGTSRQGRGIGYKDNFEDFLSLPGIDLLAISDQELQLHALGLVFVLSARLSLGMEITLEFLDLCIRLCHVAEPYQLVLAPARVADFSWGILRLSQQLKDPFRCQQALHRLLVNSHHGPYFSGVHAAFLECCLVTKAFTLGRQSLVPVYVNAKKNETTYLDILTYHHHAGTICAAVGEFDKAANLFTFASSMPTRAASAIQLACAKRALLCEILSTGKCIEFPLYLSSAVTRAMEKTMTEYNRLARSFEAHDWKTVEETSKGAIFSRDCNRGLVDQILASITKQRILKLHQTYSRLTLRDLATKLDIKDNDEVGIASVKYAITSMVSRNEISATISSFPEIVTFMGDDDFASPDQMQKLAYAQTIASWHEGELKEASKSIGLSTPWLQKQVSLNVRNKGGAIVEVGKGLKAGNSSGISDDVGSAPIRGVGSNVADPGY